MKKQIHVTLNVYENKPEVEKVIGWKSVPDYLRGDSDMPYVLHDHRRGVFTYVAEIGAHHLVKIGE